MKFNSRAVLIPLSIIVIYTIIRLYLYSRYNYTGDEAEYINNAWRAYSGGLPYKDFWLLFPPAEVYLPALWFKISGVDINLLLYSNILVTLSAALLFYLILTELQCSRFYSLLSSLFFVLHGDFFLFSVLCLIACYLLLKYQANGKKIVLVCCGLVAGIALLFRIYHVAPFCIAAFCLLLLQQKPVALKIKDAGRLVLAAAIPVMLTIICLSGIAGIMFKALLVDAVSHGTSLPLPYWQLTTEGWNKIFIYYNYSQTQPAAYPLKGIVIIFSEFLSNSFIRVVPFIVIPCFIKDLLSGPFTQRLRIKLFFILWGLLYLPYALNLSGNDHLVQAFMPFLVLLYLYIYETIFSKSDQYLKYLTGAGFCIILFTSTTKIYQVYNPSPVTRYHLETETGSLVFINERSYDMFRKMTDAILSNTQKGDYIFSLCWKAPPFYALTERQDPTYYDSPVDLILRPAKWKENNIINDLQRTRTKVVLVETNYSLIRNNDVNTSEILPTLMAFINSNYRLYLHYPNYDVYLLKQ